MEAWASQRGISYLNGALMSFPDGIGNRECTVLYSGSGEIFRLLLWPAATGEPDSISASAEVIVLQSALRYN